MLPWFHAGVSVCLPIGRPTGYYLCPPMLPFLEGALFLGTWGAVFPGLLLVVRRQDGGAAVYSLADRVLWYPPTGDQYVRRLGPMEAFDWPWHVDSVTKLYDWENYVVELTHHWNRHSYGRLHLHRYIHLPRIRALLGRDGRSIYQRARKEGAVAVCMGLYPRLGRESLLYQLDKPLVDAIIEYAYPTREEGASANPSCPNADSAHVSLGRRHCVRWRRRRRWRSVCR